MHAHSFKRKENAEEQKKVLSKALIRMADYVGFTRGELSRMLGVSESSLSRLYDGKRYIDPFSKEGELAALLLRLFRSLDTLLGGNQKQCQLWLRHHNEHVGGIPVELIQTIQGLALTTSYLDAMRGKI